MVSLHISFSTISKKRKFSCFKFSTFTNQLFYSRMFITPNIVNDAHDTTIDYASQWLEYWLFPLLEDKRFNNDRTLVVISFDEASIENPTDQIFVAAVGGSIPKSLVNTTDPLCEFSLRLILPTRS